MLGSFEEAYGIVKLINGPMALIQGPLQIIQVVVVMQMGDKSFLERFWKTLLTSLEE